MRPAIQNKMDGKTKPLGSLGKLEDLAVQLGLIQSNLTPQLGRKLMLTFAADHGITEEGISAFPSEVTYQMVDNMLNGGAAINVICQHYGIEFKLIDVGVKGIFTKHPAYINKKVMESTRNFSIESAMRQEEAEKAIEAGITVLGEEYQKETISVLGLGEVGIGNTTAATAIICAVTGISPAEATGRGTGLDDQGLQHKANIIEKALKLHQLDSTNGFEILRKVGGLELAGMAGAMLAAAARKIPVVLDGVICTSAALVAYLIKPEVKDYFISGHKSVEQAQKSALEYMELTPVLDLNMRLGEGTGSAVCIGMADMACAIMRDMASFADAGVSESIMS